MDAKLDTRQKMLHINGVLADPGYETDAITRSKLRKRVENFADFLDVEKVP
jgi:uncharacterized protein YcaQ